MFHYNTPEILKQADPEIFSAMESELDRQQDGLELIASENYVSEFVMAAQGSVLTNKYAEGYPGKRYYGGCVHVDTAEEIAIARLRKLFKCDDSSAEPYAANVQPHSGAQANMAVYLSMMEPGDLVLGMDLSHGGHLTHGSPVNFSGKLYKASHYGVRKDDEQIDYDALEEQANSLKPKMIIAGASAYPRTIDFERMGKIAKSCGAYLMVDMAHIAGLVAAGAHPSPFGHADFVTSTTHKTLRGPRGGIILSRMEYAKKINSAVFPGMQGGPLMHTIAAKAVAFGEALDTSFQDYQKQVCANAQSLATAMTNKGLRLVGGGTDNHLVLLDVSTFGLTGKEMEKALDEVHITVNKNTIPFETKSPFVTSGIRIGTPAVTSRGLKEAEMEQIADCILKVCDDLKAQTGENREVTEATKSQVREIVTGICKQFPIYK